MTFSVTAVDPCSGATAVVCSPPSGSVFPLGSTTVKCTATDPAGNTASCSFQVQVDWAPVGVTFCNPARIGIPHFGVGNVYGSPINISGLSGTVTSVAVRLNQMTHTFPDDLDLLLVGPNGRRLILMSDCGGADDLLKVTLDFTDAAPGVLPNSKLIAPGVHRPSNYGDADFWPFPAPPPPYSSRFSAFNGMVPNGTWRLYLVDDAVLDAGAIEGGWCLTIATTSSTATTSQEDGSSPDPGLAIAADETLFKPFESQLVLRVVAVSESDVRSVHLNVSSPVECESILESSSDLTMWTQVRSVSIQPGGQEITVEDPGQGLARFYRLRIVLAK